MDTKNTGSGLLNSEIKAYGQRTWSSLSKQKNVHTKKSLQTWVLFPDPEEVYTVGVAMWGVFYQHGISLKNPTKVKFNVNKYKKMLCENKLKPRSQLRWMYLYKYIQYTYTCYAGHLYR